MPDKGKIMSQAYYEKQSKLFKLYRESFARKEINRNEAVKALRLLGYSETIAAIRVNEWTEQFNTNEPETGRAKKLRLKQQTSLEKYMLSIWPGKEYYDLREKYTQMELSQKELSKNEIVEKLIHLGYSRKFSERTVNKWEMEKKWRNRWKNRLF